jgi:hypothetical protein
MDRFMQISQSKEMDIQVDEENVMRVSVGLLVCVFLSKKSHKIFFMEESIEFSVILNTKRHFISHNKKSQSNTNRFRCPKKNNLDCLN